MRDRIAPQGRPDFRLDHVMIRVQDLDRAIGFYSGLLGMNILRRAEYPGGRFTNVFLGFGDNDDRTALELTWNWDRDTPYPAGECFGHLALIVPDVVAATDWLERQGVTIRTPARRMAHGTRMIGFVLDPEGIPIEIIEPLDQA